MASSPHSVAIVIAIVKLVSPGFSWSRGLIEAVEDIERQLARPRRSKHLLLLAVTILSKGFVCRYTWSAGTERISAQLLMENWHGWIADPALVDAILDRFVPNAYSLHVTEESQRKPSGIMKMST